LENERTTPRATFRRGQLSLQSNEIFWQNEPNSEEIASSCQLRASICCRTRCFSAVFSAGGATTKPAPRAHNSRPRSICSGRVFRFRSQSRIKRSAGQTPKLTDLSVSQPWMARADCARAGGIIQGIPFFHPLFMGSCPAIVPSPRASMRARLLRPRAGGRERLTVARAITSDPALKFARPVELS
jgi:hypothetical protein